MSQLLTRAISIAKRVHAAQVDKGGHPYIEHPLRVMNAVNGESEKIVAVLHDTLEDSEDSERLLSEFRKIFSPEIVGAIQAISKQEGESYWKYIKRLESNPIALRVKIADLRDNLDLSRIANPSPSDLSRSDRYQQVLNRLTKRRDSS
jgi:(p)ppGpp synthase/HD superfamily hydrolase